MKTLLLLLVFSPLTFAADNPACKPLSEAFKFYDSKVQFLNMRSFESDGTPKPLCKEDENLAIIEAATKDLSTEAKDAIKKFGCDPLVAIDDQLAKLENEQSLLIGFEKLKTSILENKNKVADPNPVTSKLAGLNFIDGLNAAVSLEQMLEADGTFLKIFKDVPPDKRATPKLAMAEIAKKCQEGKSGFSGLKICAKDAFQPNDEALKALNELIQPNTNLDAPTLQSWADALAIKTSDDKPTTFEALKKLLGSKIPEINAKKLNLNKEQLSAIKALPDFKGRALSLAGMKSDMKNFEVMQDYKIHIKDLSYRQKYEYIGKATAALNVLMGNGFEPNKNNAQRCLAMKQDYDNAVQCMEAIQKAGAKLGASDKASFDRLHKSMTVTKDYIKSLEDKSSACLETAAVSPDKDKALPKACEDAFGDAPKRLVSIAGELQGLRELRKSIGDQNAETIKFRNGSLAKLRAGKCLAEDQLSLQCHTDNMSISQSAAVLTNHIVDIVTVDHNEPMPDLSEDCKDEKKKFSFKEALCATKAEAPPKKPEPKVSGDDYQAPVAAPEREEPWISDTTLQGLGLVAGQALGTLLTPQPDYNWYPAYNPYQYGYSNYGYGYGMGIGDQIIYDARYYGAYGGYAPTGGLQPYTGFGQYSLTNYHTTGAGSKSAYFR